jgi:hypothetical protein
MRLQNQQDRLSEIWNWGKDVHVSRKPFVGYFKQMNRAIGNRQWAVQIA